MRSSGRENAMPIAIGKPTSIARPKPIRISRNVTSPFLISVSWIATISPSTASGPGSSTSGSLAIITIACHTTRMIAKPASGQPSEPAARRRLRDGATICSATFQRLTRFFDVLVELGESVRPRRARARDVDAYVGNDAARTRRHYEHAVAEEHRFFDAMRYEDHALARAAGEDSEVDRHLLARDRVERAERLI